jgi:RHS repeat-associated protein
METNTWTYYINGASRIAKVEPVITQQPIKNQGLDPLLRNSSFYVSDHLGNTRVVYDIVINEIVIGHSSECVKVYNLDYAADYYPYGKALREFRDGRAERYLSTQHERDQETGFDYRGARYYDSDVARFLSLDPISAMYPTLSDYSYAANMPIRAVDPDGRKIYFVSDANSTSSGDSKRAMKRMIKTNVGKKVWNELKKSKTQDVYIQVSQFRGDKKELAGYTTQLGSNGFGGITSGGLADIGRIKDRDQVISGEKQAFVVTLNSLTSGKEFQDAYTLFHELEYHVKGAQPNIESSAEDREIAEHLSVGIKHVVDSKGNLIMYAISDNSIDKRFLVELRKSYNDEDNKEVADDITSLLQKLIVVSQIWNGLQNKMSEDEFNSTKK